MGLQEASTACAGALTWLPFGLHWFAQVYHMLYRVSTNVCFGFPYICSPCYAPFTLLLVHLSSVVLVFIGFVYTQQRLLWFTSCMLLFISCLSWFTVCKFWNSLGLAWVYFRSTLWLALSTRVNFTLPLCNDILCLPQSTLLTLTYNTSSVVLYCVFLLFYPVLPLVCWWSFLCQLHLCLTWVYLVCLLIFV